MSRLPVIESSREFEGADPSNSVTTERNRLMSWDSTAQQLTSPVGVTPRPKNAIVLRPPSFVSEITRLFFASLATLPYALFKLGYEIAKLVTRSLSRIRRFLFMAK
jgi:hypothetical protein